MARKNETTVLVLALLVLALLMTIWLLGTGIWWLGRFLPDRLNQPQQANNPVDSFAKVQDVPTGLFSYGGSTTWAPIRKDVDQAIQTIWPQFRLRYTDPTTGAPGSGTGIKMLLNNQFAFSQSSRSLKAEEYQEAVQRGFTLKEIPVAIDGIAIAAHPDLNVAGLTLVQLKDIYSGNLTNWSQMGGPNLAITPYSRRLAEGGTIEFFAENVLEGGAFGANVEFVPATTQALRKVAANPGGIYYASAPEVVPQCTVKSLPLGRQAETLVPPYQEPFVPLTQCPSQRNQLNAQAFQTGDYPITRRLFVIVKQNGQDDEQAGNSYAQLLLTAQGQELITKAGFVSIR